MSGLLVAHKKEPHLKGFWATVYRNGHTNTACDVSDFVVVPCCGTLLGYHVLPLRPHYYLFSSCLLQQFRAIAQQWLTLHCAALLVPHYSDLKDPVPPGLACLYMCPSYPAFSVPT